MKIYVCFRGCRSRQLEIPEVYREHEQVQVNPGTCAPRYNTGKCILLSTVTTPWATPSRFLYYIYTITLILIQGYFCFLAYSIIRQAIIFNQFRNFLITKKNFHFVDFF